MRPPGLLPPPSSSSPRLTYCDRDTVGSSVAGPRPSPLLPLIVHVAPTSSPDCPASTREATKAGIESDSLCIVFSPSPLRFGLQIKQFSVFNGKVNSCSLKVGHNKEMDATALSHRPLGQHIIYPIPTMAPPQADSPHWEVFLGNHGHTIACIPLAISLCAYELGTYFLGMQLVRWWSSEMSVAPKDVSKSIAQSK
ncbi:uncharacterized protein [Triticum aestivum]|uniref:uncharacterized protein isoform X1 n=1 Tax=Triticum aestivum TaxID=4565 RepID=UPI001D005023|nr:uncharacterized protein LOC123127989 isoform X1 [Triticum aestivum]XP_044403809.1 uncharacterized protein LOC123127989 isoform X1 [Triticum aestivum]XP_044403810.1 uncharacterized protein LOC123127989 isoform X1 [Triticum aestivum]